MSSQAIVLSICCVASLGASRDCAAQAFGTLNAGREGQSLAQCAEDPTMAKWLRTLPQHDSSRKSVFLEAFDENPIGGRVYHFSTLSQSERSVDDLTPGAQLFPRVRVVDRLKGASAVVRVNDRGPKQPRFVIDLSQTSAKALGVRRTAPVKPVKPSWARAANFGKGNRPVLEGRSSATAPETAQVAPEGKLTSTPTPGEHSLNVKLPGVVYPRGSATGAVAPILGPKDRSHSALEVPAAREPPSSIPMIPPQIPIASETSHDLLTAPRAKEEGTSAR